MFHGDPQAPIQNSWGVVTPKHPGLFLYLWLYATVSLYPYVCSCTCFYLSTSAAPNLFRLADHFVNLFRLADHHCDHLTFPWTYFKFHPKKMLMTFLAYFYLFKENFCYFRGFRAAISFFSTIYMSNYKHLTNINQFYFAHKTFFLPFLGGPASGPSTRLG